jgi:hypothetical protein
MFSEEGEGLVELVNAQGIVDKLSLFAQELLHEDDSGRKRERWN